MNSSKQPENGANEIPRIAAGEEKSGFPESDVSDGENVAFVASLPGN